MTNPKAAAHSLAPKISARRRLCLAIAAQFFAAAPAFAGPAGGVITGGQGDINQSGSTTTIRQGSHKLAIDWQDFDIGADERVQFIQPGRDSVALNRILSNDGSQIQGRLDANGQIILVNPNGVFFGENSNINVGSLTASGLDVDPAEFMNGDYALSAIEGSDGAVINRGIIQAASGGSVTLVGQRVDNQGLITADLGHVTLAAGKQAVLTFDGDQMLGVRVDEAILQDELGVEAAVKNSGRIEAKDGRVLLTASASQDIFSKAVNAGELDRDASVVFHDDGSFTLGGGADVVNTGAVDVSGDTGGQIVVLGENIDAEGSLLATGASGRGGQIELSATDKVLASAAVDVSSASAHGGDIKLTGARVGLDSGAELDASGATGGSIAIGGGRGGKVESIRNSSRTAMAPDASVTADGHNGDAGSIIFWSDDATAVTGTLSAAATGAIGDGGFIEVSSAGQLRYTGTANIGSVNGARGQILFDPRDIFIEASDGTTGSRDDSQLIDQLIAVADVSDAGEVDFLISDASISNALNTGDVIIQADRQIVVESDTRIQVADPTTSTSSLIFESDDRFMIQNDAEILLGSGDLIVTAGASPYLENFPYNPDYGSILLGRAFIRTDGNVRLRSPVDVFTTGGGPDIQGAVQENASGIFVHAGNGIFFSGLVNGESVSPAWRAATIDIRTGGGASSPIYELPSGENYAAPILDPNDIYQNDAIELAPALEPGIVIQGGNTLSADAVNLQAENGGVSLDALDITGTAAELPSDVVILSTEAASVSGTFDQLQITAPEIDFVGNASVMRDLTLSADEVTQAAPLVVGGALIIGGLTGEGSNIILGRSGNEISTLRAIYSDINLRSETDVGILSLIQSPLNGQANTAQITTLGGAVSLVDSHIALQPEASLLIVGRTFDIANLVVAGENSNLNLRSTDAYTVRDVTSEGAGNSIVATFASVNLETNSVYISGQQLIDFSYEEGTGADLFVEIAPDTNFGDGGYQQSISGSGGRDVFMIYASSQFSISGGDGDDRFVVGQGEFALELNGGSGSDTFEAIAGGQFTGQIDGGEGDDTFMYAAGGEFQFQTGELSGEGGADITGLARESIEFESELNSGSNGFFSGAGTFVWNFVDSDTFTIAQYDESGAIVREGTYSGYLTIRAGSGAHSFDFESSSAPYFGTAVTEALALNTVNGPTWEATFSPTEEGGVQLAAEAAANSESMTFSSVDRIINNSSQGRFDGTVGVSQFTLNSETVVDALLSSGASLQLEAFTNLTLDPTSDAVLESSRANGEDVAWLITGPGVVTPLGAGNEMIFEGVRELIGTAQFAAEGSVDLLITTSVTGRDSTNLWEIDFVPGGARVSLSDQSDGTAVKYAEIQLVPITGGGFKKIIGGSGADTFDIIGAADSVAIYGSSGADDVVDIIRNMTEDSMSIEFSEGIFDTESTGILNRTVEFNEIETIFGKVADSPSESERMVASAPKGGSWTFAGGENEVVFYGAGTGGTRTDQGVTLQGVDSIAGSNSAGNAYRFNTNGRIAVDIQGGLSSDTIFYTNGEYVGTASLGDGDDTIAFRHYLLASAAGTIDLGAGNDRFESSYEIADGMDYSDWHLTDGSVRYGEGLTVNNVEVFDSGQDDFNINVSGVFEQISSGGGADTITLNSNARVRSLLIFTGDDVVNIHFGAEVVNPLDGRAGTDTLNLLGFESAGEFIYGGEGTTPLPGIQYLDFEIVTGLPEYTSFFGGDGATTWSLFEDGSFEIAKLDETGNIIQSDIFTDFTNIRAGAGTNVLNLQGAAYAAWTIEGDAAGDNTLQGANIDSNWTLSGQGVGSLAAASGGASTTFTNIQTLIGGSAVDSFDIAEASTFASIDGGAGSDAFNIANAINVGIISGSSGDELFTILGRQQNLNLFGGEGADSFNAETALALAGTIDGGADIDELLLGGGGGEYNFQLDESSGGARTDTVDLITVGIEDQRSVGEGEASFFGGDGFFVWSFSDENTFSIFEYDEAGALLRSGSFSQYSQLRAGEGQQDFNFSDASSFFSGSIETNSAAYNQVIGGDWGAIYTLQVAGQVRLQHSDSLQSPITTITDLDRIIDGAMESRFDGGQFVANYALNEDGSVQVLKPDESDVLLLESIERISTDPTANVGLRLDLAAIREVEWLIDGPGQVQLVNEASNTIFEGIDILNGSGVGGSTSGISAAPDIYRFSGVGAMGSLEGGGDDTIVGKDAVNYWLLPAAGGLELYEIDSGERRLYAKGGSSVLIGGSGEDTFEIERYQRRTIRGSMSGDDAVDTIINGVASDPTGEEIYVDFDGEKSGTYRWSNYESQFSDIDRIEGQQIDSASNSLTDRLFVSTNSGIATNHFFGSAGHSMTIAGTELSGVNTVQLGGAADSIIYEFESVTGTEEPITINIVGGIGEDTIRLLGRDYAGVASLGGGNDAVEIIRYEGPISGSIDLGAGDGDLIQDQIDGLVGESDRVVNWLIDDNRVTYQDGLVVSNVRRLGAGRGADIVEVQGRFDGLDAISLNTGANELVLREGAIISGLNLTRAGRDRQVLTVYSGATIMGAVDGGGEATLELVGFSGEGEFDYTSGRANLDVGFEYANFAEVVGLSITNFFGGDGATTWNFFDDGSFEIAKLDEAGNIIRSDTFTDFINIRAGVGNNRLNLNGSTYSEWTIRGDAAGTNSLRGADIDTSWLLTGAGNGSLSAADSAAVTFENMQSVLGGSGVDSFDLAADSVFAEIAGGLGNDSFQLANGINVGLIDGGDGEDTLDLRDAGGAENYLSQIVGGDAIYLPTNIETTFGEGTDTLAGVDGYNVRWLIDDSGVRVVGTDANGAAFESAVFTGKSRLLGADGDDAFELLSAGNLEIQGGAGSNSVLARYLAAEPLWSLEAQGGRFAQAGTEVAFADIQTVGALGAEEAFAARFDVFNANTITRTLIGNRVITDGAASAASHGTVSFENLSVAFDLDLGATDFVLNGISELVGNGGALAFASGAGQSYAVAGEGVSAVGEADNISARGFSAYALGAGDGLVSVAATTASFSVDAGAGDDIFALQVAPATGLELLGGAGVDTVDAALLASADWNIGGSGVQLAGSPLMTGMEALIGTAGVDTVTVAANTVFGDIATGAGDDQFEIGAGARVGDITGGAGNDAFNLGANVSLSNLDAGAGDDQVVVGLGLQVAGQVDGGDNGSVGDTIDVEAYTEINSEAEARELLEFITANFEHYKVFQDGTFEVGNGTNVWTITGAGSGFVRVLENPDAPEITFSQIIKLVGGTGDDQFIFADGGSIDQIEGGEGNNILTAQDLINSWLITGDNSGSLTNSANANGSLFTSIANLVGGSDVDQFNVVEGGAIGSIDGGLGSDSLTADTGLATSWALGAQNSASNVANFSAIENLVGSTGDDSFTVEQLGHGVATIDGRGGRDLLALAYEGSRLALGLEQVDSLAFAGIEAFGGAGDSSVLVGRDADGLWLIDGDNAGSVRYDSENEQIAVAFANFGQLEGGAGADRMQLAGGSVAAVTGGGGDDSLDSGATGASFEVNAEGSGESDRFGRFTGFENLRGGAGDDRVLFSTGGLITGSVDGGGGRDTFAHSGGGNIWRMDPISAGGVTTTRGQVAGASFTNFEVLEGAGVSDTLVGGDADTAWFIGGGADDSYIDLDNNPSLRVSFTGMEGFAGGAGRDQFYFAGDAVIPSLVDGGGGINTVNLSEVSGAVAVGVSAASQVPMGGVRLSQIERLTGNGQTRLYGNSDQSYTWVIDGPRAGRVQASSQDSASTVFYFDNLGAISGGAHDDVFQVLAQTNQIGLDGGGQLTADYVDYSQVAGDLSIALDTAFDGGIRGVEGIRGNNNGQGSLSNAELVGGNAGALWRIGALVDGQLADGINDGQVVTATGTLNFIDFNMLTGGAGRDVFEQAAGAITGVIAGGGGDDSLSTQISAIDALTQFDGGAGNDSLILSGGGDGFSGRYSADVDGGEFAYSTDTSAYTLQYRAVEQVDDRVQADEFAIIGGIAAETIALSNGGFKVGTGADIALAGKLDLTVVGSADDTLVFTENVNLPGTLTVRNVAIAGGATGGLTASTLNLEGTRDVGSEAARLRTNIGELTVQNAVGDIWLDEQNGLSLGRFASTGDVYLAILAGDLSSDGAITTTGEFRAATRAGDILLEGAHQISGLVSLSAAGEIELHNRAQLTLGPVTATQLTLINERGINGEGPILVSEDTLINAGGDVRLTDAGNDFNRVAIERAGDVHLVDRNAIVLNGIRADGDVLVEAAPITVADAIYAQSIDLQAGAESAFIDGELNTEGFGDVRVSADSILQNAPINAGGRTLLLANSGIAQNADIEAGGDIEAVAENGSVEVAAGVRTTSGGEVSISASDSLVLQDIDARAISVSGGSLVVSGGSLTATAGDIEVDAGSYTIGLNQYIRARNGSIRIETGAKGDVAVEGGIEAGGEVAVDAGGNINMGASGSVAGGGDVSLGSGGDVALGSVTSGGGVSIDAGNGQVTDANGAGTNVTGGKLDITAGNGISGPDGDALETEVDAVDMVTGSGDIAVRNAGDVLVERAQTGAGNVSIEATDDINIEGGAIVAGGSGDGEGVVQVTSRGGDIAQLPGRSGAAITGRVVDVLAPNGAVNADNNMVLNTPLGRILAASGFAPHNLNPAGDVLPLFVAGFKFDEQLLSVEPLEAINPAVFINVRSYFYNDISLKMPRDQLYDEEEDE